MQSGPVASREHQQSWHGSHECGPDRAVNRAVSILWRIWASGPAGPPLAAACSGMVAADLSTTWRMVNSKAESGVI